jgi:four helix bundle protein
MAVRHAKELAVYQRGYEFAMRVFDIFKQFPPEERFALTSQIRRSSRSVCMNLREAWAKRHYPAHFISKLSDCDGELNESHAALDFARDCGYITIEEHRSLSDICLEVGKMLGSMIRNPEPFLLVDSDN